jgi:hypothetical protein
MTMVDEQLSSISGLVQQFQRPASVLLRIVKENDIKPAIWLDSTPFFDAAAVERLREVMKDQTGKAV